MIQERPWTWTFLALALTLTLAPGCGDDEDEGGKKLSKDKPVAVMIETGSATTWPNLCTKYVVALADEDGEAAEAKKDTSVTVTATGGDIYTSAGCSRTGEASIVGEFEEGDGRASIYFKATDAGAGSIAVDSDGLDSGSLDLTVEAPSAALVLGHSDFVGTAADGYNFDEPYSATSVNDIVFVADAAHDRVLGWNGASSLSNGAMPDFVLGQDDLDTVGDNGAGDTGVLFPVDVSSDGTRLFVSANSHRRVLIWNSIPTSTLAAADVVVGKADMNDVTRDSVTASNIVNPGATFSDGEKLVVTDPGAARVLIWNSIPTTDGADADVVVGQPDFTTDGGSLDDDSFGNPQFAVLTAGGKLVVSDYGNHRVMIWNSIPSTNGVAADVVVGQPDFDTNASGTDASTMNTPAGLVVDDEGRLIVAEEGNQRVMIWNSIPTENGVAADVVLGQPDFTTSGGSMTQTGISSPWGLHLHDGDLWITDYGGRVLKYNLP